MASAGDYNHHVGLGQADRDALLNRLDKAQANHAAGGKDGVNRRRDKRWQYRHSDVALAVEHPGGGTARLLVFSRNLSAGGMSFLHSSFLHPGSKCTISLRRVNGSRATLCGTIVNCRHIEKNLHEVGVQFESKISPGEFVQSAASEIPHEHDSSLELASLKGCILCIDECNADRNLMQFYASSSGAQIQIAGNGIEGLTMAEQGKFIAVITDLSLSGLSGIELTKSLRSSGARMPIIATTADDRPELRTEALEAGCDAVLTKPVDFAQLTKLLKQFTGASAADAGEPMLSECWDNKAMRPLILSFLDELGRDVQLMREFANAKDFEALRRCCLSFKGSAGGYGYPRLSQTAQEIVKLLGTPGQNCERDVERLKQKIDGLALLCEAACSAKHAAAIS